MTHLEIAGFYEPFLSKYGLRWTSDGTPVLYFDGKRVVKPWKLSIDVDMPADPHGGNANTEG